jgi:hypothetical protein
VTRFEADGETAYNIAFRYRKLERVVNDRHGPNAATVLMRVALMGFVTLAELEKGFNFTTSKPLPDSAKGTPRINGKLAVQKPAEPTTTEPSPPHGIKSINELNDILAELVKLGYVSLRTNHHSMPNHVFIAEAERQVSASFHDGEGPKGKDEKHDYAIQLNVLKRKWRDEADSLANKGAFSSSKRLKLNKALSNGTNGRDATPPTNNVERDQTGPELKVRLDDFSCCPFFSNRFRTTWFSNSTSTNAMPFYEINSLSSWPIGILAKPRRRSTKCFYRRSSLKLYAALIHWTLERICRVVMSLFSTKQPIQLPE